MNTRGSSGSLFYFVKFQIRHRIFRILNKTMKRLFLIASSFLILSSKVFGQDEGPSQLYLAGGLTFPQITTEAIFSGSVPGFNQSLNLERDLNLSSHPQLIYTKAILGSRFSVALSYLHVPRSANGNLQTSITIGDSVYNIGTQTTAYFNTDYYSASLRLSLISNSLVTAGISLGGRYMMISSGIKATSYGNVFERNEKFNTPLVLPGAYASIWLPPGFIVRGSVEYMKAKISSSTASALETSAAIEFYPIRFIGIGAAISMMNIKAEDLPQNNLYLQDIRYSIKGFSVYGVLRF